MISEAQRANLDVLTGAFENGDVALLECQRISDGEPVTMLCAVGWDGEAYAFTPFAEMVSGNPFEDYRPADPDSPDGFAPTVGHGDEDTGVRQL